MTKLTKAPDEVVPVLIVGGGGAGLTASMLLARQGVEHLLVSARPSTSDLPKAHVLNLRAMEVLEDVGVAAAIAERSTPAEQMAATAYYAGFAGPDPDYGRRITRLESWGAGGEDEFWRAASPCRQMNLPQIRLEPLLKARAEELSPGQIRFGHELIDLEQEENGVRALIRDNAFGREYVVQSDYLLGADGGRRVAGLIGVEYEGLGVITQTATLHVTADFSGWATDPEVLLRWIYSPQAGVLVVMVPMGPERWGPESEEWVIHLNYPVDGKESDAQVEADVRQALGIGDLPMEIHKITRWSVEAVLASSFRVGRVLLLGDAAHRHPPTGGLGLTSAIHDAQNLCWKLAAVLAGHADSPLLDTYEGERRPVDERNCQRSLENAVNHFATGSAVGVAPENSAEENMERLRRLWSGRPEDAEHRSNVLRGMRAQSMEFSELGVEYGYSYDSAAVVPDGSEAPAPIDDIRVYQPSTRPGSALPHAWLEDEDGERRPIKDLVAPGRFLLIAGEDGGPWCEAANELGRTTGFPIDAVRIGHLDGDLHDPRCAWLRYREIESDGAILVRPDRFVAWRAPTASEAPLGDLARALSQILARPLATVRVPVGSGGDVMTSQGIDADVAIVGYGPVGQALAALLGRAGHRVVAFERHQDIYRSPRAVHLDHEIMRLLQALGLADVLAEEMVPVRDYQWFGADGEPLMRFDREDLARPGWEASYMFFQPELEAAIHSHACVPAGVSVERGWVADGLEDLGDQVELRLHRVSHEEPGKLARTGERRTVRARWVVGADGANSFVREAIEIQREDLGFQERWLVVDAEPHDMATLAHLPIASQRCDPARPTTIIQSGPRHRRWEFMLLPGEQPSDFEDPERVWALLEPWYRPQDGPLTRSTVYEFRSMVAERMRRGHVLIAGDAAHLTPPFLGQGLCSGLRDAANVAWKLDLVLRDIAHERLMNTVETERQPQNEAVIRLAIELGKVLCQLDPEAAAERDAMLRQIDAPPPLELAPLSAGLLHQPIGEPDSLAGTLSVQGVVEQAGRQGRFDEIVGRGFQLIVAEGDPVESLPHPVRKLLDTLGVSVASLDPAAPHGIRDRDGRLTTWLSERNAHAVLVRPDFYVFGAVASAHALPDLLEDLRTQLHIHAPATSGVLA